MHTMNTVESTTQLHMQTVMPRAVIDDNAAAQSGGVAAEEVALYYKKYQQAFEARQNPLLHQSPAAEQTALDNEETALWLFEAAVKKNGHELPENVLAFYTETIESASSTAAKNDSFSTTSFSTTSSNKNKSTSDNYIDLHKDDARAEEVRKLALLKLTALAKRVENLRTLMAKVTEAYKNGDATGVKLAFSALQRELESILLEFGGMEGFEGEGLLASFSGDEKGKAAAEKWARDHFGPAASDKVKLVDGKWVVVLELQTLVDLQSLFEKMEESQSRKGYLSPEEHAAMEAAVRGIYSSWEGKVTTASQIVSQLKQGHDTTNKMLSTLISNEDDEMARILSRI